MQFRIDYFSWSVEIYNLSWSLIPSYQILMKFNVSQIFFYIFLIIAAFFA